MYIYRHCGTAKKDLRHRPEATMEQVNKGSPIELGQNHRMVNRSQAVECTDFEVCRVAREQRFDASRSSTLANARPPSKLGHHLTGASCTSDPDSVASQSSLRFRDGLRLRSDTPRIESRPLCKYIADDMAAIAAIMNSLMSRYFTPIHERDGSTYQQCRQVRRRHSLSRHC